MIYHVGRRGSTPCHGRTHPGTDSLSNCLRRRHLAIRFRSTNILVLLVLPPSLFCSYADSRGTLQLRENFKGRHPSPSLPPTLPPPPPLPPPATHVRNVNFAHVPHIFATPSLHSSPSLRDHRGRGNMSSS